MTEPNRSKWKWDRHNPLEYKTINGNEERYLTLLEALNAIIAERRAIIREGITHGK